MQLSGGPQAAPNGAASSVQARQPRSPMAVVRSSVHFQRASVCWSQLVVQRMGCTGEAALSNHGTSILHLVDTMFVQDAYVTTSPGVSDICIAMGELSVRSGVDVLALCSSSNKPCREAAQSEPAAPLARHGGGGPPSGSTDRFASANWHSVTPEGDDARSSAGASCCASQLLQGSDDNLEAGSAASSADSQLVYAEGVSVTIPLLQVPHDCRSSSPAGSPAPSISCAVRVQTAHQSALLSGFDSQQPSLVEPAHFSSTSPDDADAVQSLRIRAHPDSILLHCGAAQHIASLSGPLMVACDGLALLRWKRDNGKRVSSTGPAVISARRARKLAAVPDLALRNCEVKVQAGPRDWIGVSGGFKTACATGRHVVSSFVMGLNGSSIMTATELEMSARTCMGDLEGLDAAASQVRGKCCMFCASLVAMADCGVMLVRLARHPGPCGAMR